MAPTKSPLPLLVAMVFLASATGATADSSSPRKTPPHSATAICRGNTWQAREDGKVQFINASGHTARSVQTAIRRTSDQNYRVRFDELIALGCVAGNYAYVIHRRGWEQCDDEGLCSDNREHSSSLEIFDKQGRRLQRHRIGWINSLGAIVAARDDSRIFIGTPDHLPHTKSFGPLSGLPAESGGIVYAFDPKGEVIKIELPGSSVLGPIVSSNGRYFATRHPSGGYIFADLLAGTTHHYSGKGNVWVNSSGKFEAWEGSTVKDDNSLGPDGKLVFTFIFPK